MTRQLAQAVLVDIRAGRTIDRRKWDPPTKMTLKIKRPSFRRDTERSLLGGI